MSSLTLESASLSSESVSCLFILSGCGLVVLGGLHFFALVGVDAFLSFLHSSLKNVLIVVLGSLKFNICICVITLQWRISGVRARNTPSPLSLILFLFLSFSQNISQINSLALCYFHNYV